MTDRVVGAAEVKAIHEVNKLRPKEQDFADAGIKVIRKYRKDGSYTWRAPFKPNVNGKLTREARIVGELLKPSQRADAERVAKIHRVMEHAALKDREGAVQYVDPALAGETARKNGWSHHWRAHGARVERGIEGGMLWRLEGRWVPLGVRCLGTPLKGSRLADKRGLHRDPEGTPWRWLDGAWVCLDVAAAGESPGAAMPCARGAGPDQRRSGPPLVCEVA